MLTRRILPSYHKSPWNRAAIQGRPPKGNFVVKIAIFEKDRKALCSFQARRDKQHRLTWVGLLRPSFEKPKTLSFLNTRNAAFGFPR